MNLKHEITSYLIENESDLGKEEVYNTLQLLTEYDNDLNNLQPTDCKLIVRLIDDTILYNKVELKQITPNKSNPFGEI